MWTQPRFQHVSQRPALLYHSDVGALMRTGASLNYLLHNYSHDITEKRPQRHMIAKTRRESSLCQKVLVSTFLPLLPPFVFAFLPLASLCLQRYSWLVVRGHLLIGLLGSTNHRSVPRLLPLSSSPSIPPGSLPGSPVLLKHDRLVSRIFGQNFYLT